MFRLNDKKTHSYGEKYYKFDSIKYHPFRYSYFWR